MVGSAPPPPLPAAVDGWADGGSWVVDDARDGAGGSLKGAVVTEDGTGVLMGVDDSEYKPSGFTASATAHAQKVTRRT